MSGLRTDFSECSSLCTCSQQLQPRKPFLIGVSGGTASGKSTVCQKIVQQLGDKEGDNENNQRVSIISLDSFYKDLSNEENELALLGKFDFDHPRVFDYELLKRTLLELMNGNTVEIFDYDHKLHKRNKEKSRKISSADVVLVEGILVFYQEDVRALFNMKLFVDTDADTRLARRVERDIEKYDRPLDSILHQYITFVKPAFEEFCLPTKKYADVIIPRGADNKVAVDLIVQHIKDLLHKNASSKRHSGSSSSCSVHHSSSSSKTATPSAATAAVSGPAAAVDINRNSSSSSTSSSLPRLRTFSESDSEWRYTEHHH